MGEAGADVRPRIHAGVRGGAPPRRGAVYVDDAIWEWRGLRWAHLLADDTDDLHRFAAALGIHRTSYQGPPRTSVPHYDRVRAAARARSWRDCLQPRRDRRGRASDAVVLRGVRSRSRLLTHASPRVGFLLVRYLVERGLVRLLRLGGLAFLLGALLLRPGILRAALSAHLSVSRCNRYRDARERYDAR